MSCSKPQVSVAGTAHAVPVAAPLAPGRSKVYVVATQKPSCGGVTGARGASSAPEVRTSVSLPVHSSGRWIRRWAGVTPDRGWFGTRMGGFRGRKGVAPSTLGCAHLVGRPAGPRPGRGRGLVRYAGGRRTVAAGWFLARGGSRLQLADGRRVFVKVVGTSRNPDAPHFHRREAQVLDYLHVCAGPSGC